MRHLFEFIIRGDKIGNEKSIPFKELKKGDMIYKYWLDNKWNLMDSGNYRITEMEEYDLMLRGKGTTYTYDVDGKKWDVDVAESKYGDSAIIVKVTKKAYRYIVISTGELNLEDPIENKKILQSYTIKNRY